MKKGLERSSEQYTYTMTREEKIKELVSRRLNEMDSEALENFYIDIKTEEFEEYDDEVLDELLEE